MTESVVGSICPDVRFHSTLGLPLYRRVWCHLCVDRFLKELERHWLHGCLSLNAAMEILIAFILARKQGSSPLHHKSPIETHGSGLWLPLFYPRSQHGQWCCLSRKKSPCPSSWRLSWREMGAGHSTPKKTCRRTGDKNSERTIGRVGESWERLGVDW